MSDPKHLWKLRQNTKESIGSRVDWVVASLTAVSVDTNPKQKVT